MFHMGKTMRAPSFPHVQSSTRPGSSRKIDQSNPLDQTDRAVIVCAQGAVSAPTRFFGYYRLNFACNTHSLPGREKTKRATYSSLCCTQLSLSFSLSLPLSLPLFLAANPRANSEIANPPGKKTGHRRPRIPHVCSGIVRKITTLT